MAPRPTTSTVSPGPTPLRRIARRQQASGSVKTATASGTPSGTGTWRGRVLRWHADVLGEAARVEVRGLEGPTHRDAAPAAVVTGEARHVVGDDHTVARPESAGASPTRTTSPTIS